MPWILVLAITAIVSALASILMGLWANLPIAQAPGMGLNGFFTYTVVLNLGYSWKTALGMVFVSGVFFLILTLAKVRKLIVDSIPKSLRHAISVGIGIFITTIGLVNLGLIRFTAIGGINFGQQITADLPQQSVLALLAMF